MRPLLAAVFAFMSMPAAASVCDLNPDTATRRVDLDFTPQYFFKPIPSQGTGDNSHDVSLISTGSNVQLNMENGRHHGIPGPFDGVPSPDGQLMVVPDESTQGLLFFDRDNLTTSSTPLFDDARQSGNRHLRGVYHSVGLLPGAQGNQRTYRVITDTLTTAGTQGVPLSRLMYKDYRTTMGANGPEFASNVELPRPLCPNLKGLYKLPMLSKDGQQLAAYDVQSGTTKIFNVNASGCSVKRDLGFATGKVEFSPDGQSITFAADSYPTNAQAVTWYEQPSSSKNFQVYVLDMGNGRMRQISHTDGNAYYPSFTRDGQVVYLEQTSRLEYQVVEAPIASARALVMPDASGLNSCQAQTQSFTAQTALGYLWADVCNDLGRRRSLHSLAFTAFSLNPTECRAAVRREWPRVRASLTSDASLLGRTLSVDFRNASAELLQCYQRDMSRLTEAQLLAVCPTQNVAPNEPTVVQATPASSQPQATPPANPFVQACIQCHSGGVPGGIDISNPDHLKNPENNARLREVISSGFMPMGWSANDPRRAQLLQYLEAIRQN